MKPLPRKPRRCFCCGRVLQPTGTAYGIVKAKEHVVCADQHGCRRRMEANELRDKPASERPGGWVDEWLGLVIFVAALALLGLLMRACGR